MYNKIVILTHDYAPNDGGIARLCFEIKKQLQNDNIKMEVVTMAKNSTDLEGDRYVHRIPGGRGLLEWRMLRYLLKSTTKEDIIITDTFHPGGLISILSGRRTLILAHGAELLEGKTFFRRVIWAKYRKWVLSKAEKVVANSHYTKGLVLGCSPKANAVAVPLAVDPDYFKPTCEKMNNGFLNICSISRLLKFKGHDFILESIAALPQEYKSKIRLKIGGKGNYKSSLETLAKELGLDDVVEFVGFVSDDELCNFYSESDLYILCTREEPQNRNVEGFGLVFTEAQACGTPTIGTRTGGIPDAIEEGFGGWLIEQDNKEELQQLLMNLIDNPTILQEQSVKARTRIVERCNWKVYYKQLKSLFKPN